MYRSVGEQLRVGRLLSETILAYAGHKFLCEPLCLSNIWKVHIVYMHDVDRR